MTAKVDRLGRFSTPRAYLKIHARKHTPRMRCESADDFGRFETMECALTTYSCFELASYIDNGRFLAQSLRNFDIPEWTRLQLLCGDGVLRRSGHLGAFMIAALASTRSFSAAREG
jgi:hypothetical protein